MSDKEFDFFAEIDKASVDGATSDICIAVRTRRTLGELMAATEGADIEKARKFMSTLTTQKFDPGILEKDLREAKPQALASQFI